MRERAELVGAQLTVITRRGAGTEVQVTMPLS
jgi:two-component system sensor histidine kinase DegS